MWPRWRISPGRIDRAALAAGHRKTGHYLHIADILNELTFEIAK
jgi:hypothetical protein